MEGTAHVGQLNHAITALLTQINKIAGKYELRDFDAKKVEHLSKAVASLAVPAS